MRKLLLIALALLLMVVVTRLNSGSPHYMPRYVKVTVLVPPAGTGPT